MKRHPLKRIDVGIAQVNLGWNGHHFASTWDAFAPYTNLNAAATILRECWTRKPGVSLAPASGSELARRLQIEHYPVLITDTGLTQQVKP